MSKHPSGLPAALRNVVCRATADTDGSAAGEAQIEAVGGGRRGCSSGRLWRSSGGGSSLRTVARTPPAITPSPRLRQPLAFSYRTASAVDHHHR
jgi:hypothetical protein